MFCVQSFFTYGSTEQIDTKLEARNKKYETNVNTLRTRRESAGVAGAPALRVIKILMF